MECGACGWQGMAPGSMLDRGWWAWGWVWVWMWVWVWVWVWGPVGCGSLCAVLCPRLLHSLTNLKRVIINAAHYLVLGDKDTYHYDPATPFLSTVSCTACLVWAGGSGVVLHP